MSDGMEVGGKVLFYKRCTCRVPMILSREPEARADSTSRAADLVYQTARQSKITIIVHMYHTLKEQAYLT